MTVYIVIFNIPYEVNYIQGVFATELLATEYIEALTQDSTHSTENLYTVEEWKVE